MTQPQSVSANHIFTPTYRLTILFVALLVASLLAVRRTGGLRVANNVAWLGVTREMLDPSSGVQVPAPLAQWMKEVQQQHAAGSSGKHLAVALGILAEAQGDEAGALRWWQNDTVPTRLDPLARHAGRQDRLDTALLYYGGIIQSDPTVPDWQIIGKFCQRNYAYQQTFSPQRWKLCSDLFAENDQLLFNSSFVTGDLSSWERKDGVVVVALEDGKLVAQVTGAADDAAVVGPYQWVALPEGGDIRFTATIQVITPTVQPPAILYIGFIKPDGSAAGNAISLAEDEFQPGEWADFSREFTIPAAQNQLFRFAPVQIQGPGRILVSDVSVDLIRQP